MHLSTSDLQRDEMQQTDLRDVGRGWERESNAVDVEGNNGHAADAAAAHHGLHRRLDVMNVECKKTKFQIHCLWTNLHLHTEMLKLQPMSSCCWCH